MAACELRMDERPWVLEILGADRRGAPVSKRRDGASRIVAGILGESACTLYEQVRHIPALQIDVERAVAGIAPHDRAATQMRGLVGGDVEGAGAWPLDHLFCAHPLDDFGVL